MKRWMALAMACGALLLAGCNTMAGVGKDVEKGGEAVEKAAKDVQKKM